MRIAHQIKLIANTRHKAQLNLLNIINSSDTFLSHFSSSSFISGAFSFLCSDRPCSGVSTAACSAFNSDNCCGPTHPIHHFAGSFAHVIMKLSSKFKDLHYILDEHLCVFVIENKIAIRYVRCAFCIASRPDLLSPKPHSFHPQLSHNPSGTEKKDLLIPVQVSDTFGLQPGIDCRGYLGCECVGPPQHRFKPYQSSDD